jgi:purine nucleosidase
LLDTDIGNDIDDALTLAYLLAEPSCSLLGITTVTAAPVERAKLASAIAYGRGIPIAAGAARPLTRDPLQEPPFTQVGDWPHDESFPDTAVDLLRETILAHPGEVTLLAIGPLTNVASLFQAHPEVVSWLKSLVLMGGRYFTEADLAEWNIRNDPEAAAIVFGAPVPHLRAIGIDVTRQVFLSGEQFRAAISGMLLEFAEPWLERRDRVTFHDPLAAGTIFKPFCGYEKGVVTVSGTGHTSFSPVPGGPHEIAVSVDAAGFLAEVMAHLTAPGESSAWMR